MKKNLNFSIFSDNGAPLKESQIWSLLTMTGYITVSEVISASGNSCICRVRVPNLEIKDGYKESLLENLCGNGNEKIRDKLFQIISNINFRDLSDVKIGMPNAIIHIPYKLTTMNEDVFKNIMFTSLLFTSN